MLLDDNFLIRFFERGIDPFFNCLEAPIKGLVAFFSEKNAGRCEKVNAIAFMTLFEAGAIGCIAGGSILCATGAGAAVGVPLIVAGIGLAIIGAVPLIKLFKWKPQINPQITLVAATVFNKFIAPTLGASLVVIGITCCATGPGIFVGCPLIALGSSLFAAAIVLKEA